jgi:hypothetical protein
VSPFLAGCRAGLEIVHDVGKQVSPIGLSLYGLLASTFAEEAAVSTITNFNISAGVCASAAVCAIELPMAINAARPGHLGADIVALVGMKLLTHTTLTALRCLGARNVISPAWAFGVHFAWNTFCHVVALTTQQAPAGWGDVPLQSPCLVWPRSIKHTLAITMVGKEQGKVRRDGRALADTEKGVGHIKREVERLAREDNARGARNGMRKQAHESRDLVSMFDGHVSGGHVGAAVGLPNGAFQLQVSNFGTLTEVTNNILIAIRPFIDDNLEVLTGSSTWGVQSLFAGSGPKNRSPLQAGLIHSFGGTVRVVSQNFAISTPVNYTTIEGTVGVGYSTVDIPAASMSQIAVLDGARTVPAASLVTDELPVNATFNSVQAWVGGLTSGSQTYQEQVSYDPAQFRRNKINLLAEVQMQDLGSPRWYLRATDLPTGATFTIVSVTTYQIMPSIGISITTMEAHVGGHTFGEFQEALHSIATEPNAMESVTPAMEGTHIEHIDEDEEGPHHHLALMAVRKQTGVPQVVTVRRKPRRAAMADGGILDKLKGMVKKFYGTDTPGTNPLTRAYKGMGSSLLNVLNMGSELVDVGSDVLDNPVVKDVMKMASSFV